MRILCVHGWISTPEHMKSQMETWEKELPEAEFLYYRGKIPFPASANVLSPQARKFHNENRILTAFAHFDFDIRIFSVGYDMPEEIIIRILGSLIKKLNVEKNIAGLIGFSQGAALVDFFLIQLQKGALDKYLMPDVIKPLFAILICFPYQPRSTVTIKTPTLIIFSDNDEVTDNPELLSIQYQNPRIMEFSISHNLPRMNPILKETVRSLITDGVEKWMKKVQKGRL